MMLDEMQYLQERYPEQIDLRITRRIHRRIPRRKLCRHARWLWCGASVVKEQSKRIEICV